MSDTNEVTDTPAADNEARCLLMDEFFAPLLEALNNDVKTRRCAVIDDLNFTALLVQRVLEGGKSGRDFIQTHGMPSVNGLNRSNYFDSISSKRRLVMLQELDGAIRDQNREILREHDDRLAHLTELDDMEIWAGDGHQIAHATHDPRSEKGAYRPVNLIYKLDMRTGWMSFIDLARPTARGIEHEITTLKRQDREELRCGAAKGKHAMMVYDAAIVDFQYAYNLKQSKGVYILTAWKENLAPMTVMPRDFDRNDPINTYVIKDETVYFENTVGAWRRITAECPDSEETYVTLTNQMNYSPGALNQCRRLRWNIEKAFNQQEHKFDETKAWAANETGKRIQAVAMAITHNLVRLFEMKLKKEEGIEDVKVIKAWRKQLQKRIEKARIGGRELHEKLYQALYRPTEVSLQFIRWLRVSLSRKTCYRSAIEQLRPLMIAYL